MSGLKVCLLNDSFPPLIDGVGNAVVNYARNIQKNGGSPTVVTPFYPSVSDGDFEFPIVRYPSVNMTKLFGYRAGFPFDIPILKELNGYNFDIIHSHCPIASTMLARSLREISGPPLVFTYHTKFDIDIKKTVKTEPLQKLAIKLLVNNIEACDEVWVVSHGAGENLRGLGFTGDYRVMANGVDFERGRATDAEIQAINQKHGIAADETVFLFVGRMMWYKGIRLILDGVKKAKEQGKRFRMLFVGDGTDFSEIKAYAGELHLGDTCIFAGAERDRNRLRAYFCRASLFLFPSTYDTNGIVVREAAACGLASLLVEGSCAAEGVTDERNGFLVAENADAIAQKIQFGCENPAVLAEIGMHAMEEIYLSWETAVKYAYDAYGEIHEKQLAGVYSNNKKRVALDRAYAMLAELVREVETLQKLPQKLKEKNDTDEK